MMQALELKQEAIVLGFAGLDLSGEMLGVDPRLPPEWRSRHSACVGGVAPCIAGKTLQAALVEGEG
jgi:hypothetical protein